MKRPNTYICILCMHRYIQAVQFVSSPCYLTNCRGSCQLRPAFTAFSFATVLFWPSLIRIYCIFIKYYFIFSWDTFQSFIANRFTGDRSNHSCLNTSYRSTDNQPINLAQFSPVVNSFPTLLQTYVRTYYTYMNQKLREQAWKKFE